MEQFLASESYWALALIYLQYFEMLLRVKFLFVTWRPLHWLFLSRRDCGCSRLLPENLLWYWKPLVHNLQEDFRLAYILEFISGHLSSRIRWDQKARSTFMHRPGLSTQTHAKLLWCQIQVYLSLLRTLNPITLRLYMSNTGSDIGLVFLHHSIWKAI